MKENDELRGRLKVSLKELLRGAEEERRRILHEVESLKRERERVRAGKDLLECAVRCTPRQLRTRRDQAQAHESGESPLEKLLQSFPILNPLSKDEEAVRDTSTTEVRS
ncbi:MAG: hypothetical protein QXT64_06650 [Desulfurococcaceae archaeon]